MAEISYFYLKNGSIRYAVTISHDGLNKIKEIKGDDRFIIEQKALAQCRDWNEKFKLKAAKEAAAKKKKAAAKDFESKKAEAEERTNEAQIAQNNIVNTLAFTLDIDDKVNWESLKNHSDFSEPEPRQPSPIKKPKTPQYEEYPPEPLKTAEKYIPKLNILDKIIASSRQKKIDEAIRLFDNDHADWVQCVENTKKRNCERELSSKKQIADWEAKILEQEDRFNEELAKWQINKEKFLKQQNEGNAKIDELKAKYFESDERAIIEQADLVLTSSQYPDEFPMEFDIDYNPENKIMIVDYNLPSLDQIPTLTEVKYVKSKDEFQEKHLSDSGLNKLYDSLLYQIVVRSIHELYEADEIDGIEALVFNGWVESIDKGTGNKVTACVMSIQTNKKEFLEINLANVEPKACFKNLKGVGSSKLHSLTPIAPLLQINKEDKRFVDSYDVADGLDDSVNIAAMDWEDFEHLVREIFEKEFRAGGGEVKVTQASRDGGVDAIAFDPDPIRGGKIVIQAKRYTNVVGVSAVRDLYGTVVNEGAIKGILISTADYGPDAYAFASDKPLTLLNGNNLLHLLEKHGHKAKIDLKEAKLLLADQ